MPALAVDDRLGPSDEAVADEERQDVVAVLALRRGDVHLEAVEEVPQRLGAVAVVDQAVERREQRRAVGDRSVGGVRVGEQAALLEPDAERAEALLVERTPSLRLGHGVAGRVDPLGEIPEPLPPAPSGDGDLAPEVQDRQHVADAPRAVPAVVARLALGAVVELA